jgi:CheY-like chemotaxis protein
MSKKHSVLLVDDDKFLLDMYRKKFDETGIEVNVALGSEEALGKLREGLKPEIMILDIIMPGMDGIELLQNIRKEKLSPDSIVIMLTNESDKEKIDQARSLGVKGYIVKATSIPSEVVDEAMKIAKLNNFSSSNHQIN